MQCMNCGRKFNENSLRIHLKSCTSNNPAKGVKGKEFSQAIPQSNNASNFPPQKNSVSSKTKVQEEAPLRPKALLCYICGREFGTKSLGIHIKTCIKKWEDEEVKKPRSERRPVPQPPPLLFDANNKYVYEALVKCPNCGRTFTDQSFKSHQKSCTAENPAKSVGGNNSKSNSNNNFQNSESKGLSSKNKEYEIEDNYEEVQREECAVCGRKFAIDRLEKHQKVCKKAKIKDDARPKPEAKAQPVKAEPITSNKWRDQHKEFVESMKYMREVKKREEKGLPIKDLKPPKRSEDSSLVQCPHCGRKFNERKMNNSEAANRHIAICANVVNKPKSVAQNVGKYTNQQIKPIKEETKLNYNPKKYK